MSRLLSLVFSWVRAGRITDDEATELLNATPHTLAETASVVADERTAASGSVPAPFVSNRAKGRVKVRYQIVDRALTWGGLVGNNAKLYRALFAGNPDGMTVHELTAASGLVPKATESAIYALKFAGVIRPVPINDDARVSTLPAITVPAPAPVVTAPVVAAINDAINPALDQPTKRSYNRRSAAQKRRWRKLRAEAAQIPGARLTRTGKIVRPRSRR